MVGISFPVVFRLPAMFFAIPPLVVLIPATLAFGVQVAAALVGLAAVITLIVDRPVQVGFRLFYGVLALRPVIGMRLWSRGYEQHERPGDQRRNRTPYQYELSVQGSSSSSSCCFFSWGWSQDKTERIL
jgi:hypothetical protein